MANKYLKGKGEMDYDLTYDILFFKTSERHYRKSIEIDNFVVDIDEEGFIVGIQIMEASKFLKLSKPALLKIRDWQFEATINDGRIEIRLVFRMKIRNQLIEKNPIIIEPISEQLPNSRLVCAA